MFNVNKAVHECDFCGVEINKIFRIYATLGQLAKISPMPKSITECCYSCQQHRKNNSDIIKQNNRYYWR